MLNLPGVDLLRTGRRDQTPITMASHLTLHPWNMTPAEAVGLQEELRQHIVILTLAIDLTLRCDGGYRLPEPTRRAHVFVNELRKAGVEGQSGKGTK